MGDGWLRYGKKEVFVVYFVLFAKGFFADKAHRKKQGEGVVPYVEPLLRSNEVCEKRFGKHNVGGTADFFSKFVPDRSSLSGTFILLCRL